MKVRHDYSDLQEGEDIVMTLKDQFLVTEDYKENEDDDILENVHMLEKKKNEHNSYMKENLHKLKSV